MKNTVFALVSMFALGAAAYPQITAQRVGQDVLKRLNVSYTVDEPAVVIADILVDGVPVPADQRTTFKGDINVRVEAGPHSFTWKPRKEGFASDTLANFQVVIRAYSVNRPPDYMTVGLDSPYAVRYYETADAVPNGVSNATYKTDTLLMRLIPAANVGWVMGAAPYEAGNVAREMAHRVTLTSDYYIGVYPVTQGQYYKITGERPSTFKNRTDRDYRPVETVAYQTLRGTASDSWVGWPQKGHAVLEGSALYTLRDRTGVEFDLPTDAQWEYAGRAGARTTYYTGPASLGDLTNIAWCAQNSYDAQGNQNETHAVGGKLPNAWGLYDMQGNVYEMCLDVHANMTSAEAIDPVGPDASAASGRVQRGGSYSGSGLMDFSLSLRNISSVDGIDKTKGFRLACPAEAVK